MKQIAALIGFLLLVSSPALEAQREGPATPETALERLFMIDAYHAEWFAAEFVAQVPPERLRAIVNTLTNTLGPYQRIEAVGEDYEIVFQDSRVPTVIRLDTRGRIETLLFQMPGLTGSDGPAAVPTALDETRFDLLVGSLVTSVR